MKKTLFLQLSIVVLLAGRGRHTSHWFDLYDLLFMSIY
jgi:hypothetical protein